MTRDPIWDALKARSKEKFDLGRRTNLAEANDKDDGNWVHHTRWHWSRTVNGKQLNYWPSRKKFQYAGGRVSRGDVYAFIKTLMNNRIDA